MYVCVNQELRPNSTSRSMGIEYGQSTYDGNDPNTEFIQLSQA